MDPLPPAQAVELVPHRPEWAQTAEAEAARLGAALGPVLVTVHHIGSTAIPAIRAKPILDLIPVVTTLDALDATQDALRAAGYLWHGEFGIAGRRFCTRIDVATGKRIVHLHAFADGDAEITRHLAFRDYLRTHPAIAQAYKTEKLRAAAATPDDSQAYNAGKNDWIKRVEREALDWASIRPPAP